ncbi:acyl-CoA dehydrogenase family protein, partial [Leucobacter sp. M11]|uniref:acyl-CoA dehydrogenase family protein n=1 Tax=Leucobacter sp. M11 TaxID=2993565 RepID=UPI002D7EFB35
MDFSLTPRQQELRERAASWTRQMYRFEDDCERNNGLSPEQHREVHDLVLSHGLGGMNMPAEWGGTGLNTLEHTIVQEQVGRLTGALWDTLWR